MMRYFLCVCAMLVLLATPGYVQSIPKEYQAVAQILGKSGQYEHNIFMLTIPRRQPTFSLFARQVPPHLGLTHEIDMTKLANGQYSVVAELVLLQQEVNPVADVLQRGLVVSAVHSHHLGDAPHALYLHCMGMGTPTQLAQALRAALNVLNTVPRAPWMAEAVLTTPPVAPPANTLPRKELNRIVGLTGEQQEGGVYNIPSIGQISRCDGMECASPDPGGWKCALICWGVRRMP